MEAIYEERVSSLRTSALFGGLTILLLAGFVWRAVVHGFGPLAAVLLVLSVIFLFYTANYRTLVLRLTSESLKLRFGIFTVTIPIESIDTARHDDLPPLLRYGGAGIHWMAVHGRYRISLNFLEHPRVVLTLHHRLGLARDVSFTTRRPGEIIRHLQEVKR